MEKVIEKFKEFDQQGSGRIPRSVLLQVLQELSVPEAVAIRALDGSGQNAGDTVNYMEFLAWVGKSSTPQPLPFRPATRTVASVSPEPAQAHQQADQLGGAADIGKVRNAEEVTSSASTATPGRLATSLSSSNMQMDTCSDRKEEVPEQARQRQMVPECQKEWKARIECAEVAYKAGRLAEALDQIETAFSQRFCDDKNAAAVRLRTDIEAAAMVQDRQFRCGLARSSPYQGQHASWAAARQQATSLPLSDVSLVEQSMEAEWTLFSWEQRLSSIQRELPRLRHQREEARGRK